MKKLLHYINHNGGFVFPYVLLISAAVFLLITSAIQRYVNEMTITENTVEQLRAETLFQMSRNEIIKELKQADGTKLAGRINYTYPDGAVSVQYNRSIDAAAVHFSIVTASGTYQSFAQQLDIPLPEKPSKKEKRKKQNDPNRKEETDNAIQDDDSQNAKKEEDAKEGNENASEDQAVR